MSQASDRAQLKKIEEGTERIGCHEYFDQANHKSEHVSPEVTVDYMLEV